MGGDLPEKKRSLLPGRTGRQPNSYRPGPFALTYTALLAAGTLAAAVVYLVLVHGVPGMATDRADTLKTALLVVGGSGALAGLYVAYRKQRTEEANHLRDQDKLFTERYTQAAAQLGAPAAAVRLAGVYALARIADDSERDRPTCLRVLCAYLRMPYQPDKAEPAEREVRTTAQTVLAERLHPNHPGHWPNAAIDLRGAQLFDLDFSDTVIGQLRAERATFTERAAFSAATFTGPATFSEATFTGLATFTEATFTGAALFDLAAFTNPAWFSGVTFAGGVTFSGASFTRDATFSEATFNLAAFVGTTFTGNAMFKKATFTGGTTFSEVTFTRDVTFGEANFTGPALFSDATFTGSVRFEMASFEAPFTPIWPDGFAEPPGIIRRPWDPDS